MGNAGARFDSDAFAFDTVALVTAPKVPWATASSPAAKPVGAVTGLAEALGEGLGLGLGDGDGLTDGLGVAVGLAIGTDMELAPVNKEIAAVDSVLIAGANE